MSDSCPSHRWGQLKVEEKMIVSLLDRRTAKLESPGPSTAPEVDSTAHRAQRTVLPICMYCRLVRNEAGAWVAMRGRAYDGDVVPMLSHSICPACLEEHYADWLDRVSERKRMSCP